MFVAELLFEAQQSGAYRIELGLERVLLGLECVVVLNHRVEGVDDPIAKGLDTPYRFKKSIGALVELLFQGIDRQDVFTFHGYVQEA